MKQWLNGLMVGLAVGFVVSIIFRQQQEEEQRMKFNPLVDRQNDEMQSWWDNLPADRKLRIQLSRAEEEGDIDEP